VIFGDWILWAFEVGIVADFEKGFAVDSVGDLIAGIAH
jgi:hypothetical protein